jgi:hypothetical protein
MRKPVRDLCQNLIRKKKRLLGRPKKMTKILSQVTSQKKENLKMTSLRTRVKRRNEIRRI